MGTFHNATLGEDYREKVKTWAREAFPEALKQLEACGKYEKTWKDEEGNEVESEEEGLAQLLGLKIFYNIDHLGRDVKP